MCKLVSACGGVCLCKCDECVGACTHALVCVCVCVCVCVYVSECCQGFFVLVVVAAVVAVFACLFDLLVCRFVCLCDVLC